MRLIQVPTPDGFGYIRVQDDEYFCPKCGWIGIEMKHISCLTLADEWWECPGCGADALSLNRPQKDFSMADQHIARLNA